jgi:hypothetical protein
MILQEELKIALITSASSCQSFPQSLAIDDQDIDNDSPNHCQCFNKSFPMIYSTLTKEFMASGRA